MNKLSMVFVVIAALSLTACNTVRGIGQDVEKGGEAIQKAVK
jgi:entericidin B